MPFLMLYDMFYSFLVCVHAYFFYIDIVVVVLVRGLYLKVPW